MYNLNIHIESEDLNYLKEVQQALSTALNSDDKVWRYSFNHIEETRRGGAGSDDRSRGVTAPPPVPDGMFDGLTSKQKLREYINEWEEYKEKRNGDFIEEEEMKL